jgi:hypothetical protein
MISNGIAEGFAKEPWLNSMHSHKTLSAIHTVLELQNPLQAMTYLWRKVQSQATAIRQPLARRKMMLSMDGSIPIHKVGHCRKLWRQNYHGINIHQLCGNMLPALAESQISNMGALRARGNVKPASRDIIGGQQLKIGKTHVMLHRKCCARLSTYLDL